MLAEETGFNDRDPESAGRDRDFGGGVKLTPAENVILLYISNFLQGHKM